MPRTSLAMATLALIALAALAHAHGHRRGTARSASPAAATTDAHALHDGRTPIHAPGDYRFRLVHDGLARSYRVHVPRSYRRGRPAPVLVALHGGGGDMDLQADDGRYGLVSASEREGFIAVFPNGFSRLPGGRFATWNAGRCCGPARDRAIDDVGFIREVVGNVARRLDIDGARIHATGMSNGGMMAYRLACDAADVFRAIAAVAGTDNTTGCKPSRDVAVIHFHARDDDHVLFGGGAGAAAFRNASAVTQFTSVPTTIDRWARLDECQGPPRRVVYVPGAYCELRAACRGGSAVQLCVTASGGHSWPGGGLARRGATPSPAISASDVMWSFFESLPPRSNR